MCRGEISKVKSRPRFVNHRFIALKRAQLLSLLLVQGRLSEISGITVIHTRHVIGVGAAWTEGDRLLSSSHGLVMATLKIANIANDEVGLADSWGRPREHDWRSPMLRQRLPLGLFPNQIGPGRSE